MQIVPLSGLKRWFRLNGHDKTDIKNRGEIKLNLMLASCIEKQLTLQERYVQYEYILSVVVEYEIRSDPVSKRATIIVDLSNGF